MGFIGSVKVRGRLLCLDVAGSGQPARLALPAVPGPHRYGFSVDQLPDSEDRPLYFFSMALGKRLGPDLKACVLTANPRHDRQAGTVLLLKGDAVPPSLHSAAWPCHIARLVIDHQYP